MGQIAGPLLKLDADWFDKGQNLHGCQGGDNELECGDSRQEPSDQWLALRVPVPLPIAYSGNRVPEDMISSARITWGVSPTGHGKFHRSWCLSTHLVQHRLLRWVFLIREESFSIAFSRTSSLLFAAQKKVDRSEMIPFMANGTVWPHIDLRHGRCNAGRQHLEPVLRSGPEPH